MKKAIYLILALLILAAVVLSGCEKKEEEIGADINTQEALQSIMDNAKAAVGESAFIPFTLDAPVTNENCKGYLGLTAEQFGEHVLESYTIIAALSSQAFDLALVKCKDYASAKEVKKLIAEGFNPSERVCATSEVAFVVESGRFVLLGGVGADTAEAFQKAFDEQFETKSGEVNKFFERGADFVDGGGFGGLLPVD